MIEDESIREFPVTEGEQILRDMVKLQDAVRAKIFEAFALPFSTYRAQGSLCLEDNTELRSRAIFYKRV